MLYEENDDGSEFNELNPIQENKTAYDVASSIKRIAFSKSSFQEKTPPTTSKMKSSAWSFLRRSLSKFKTKSVNQLTRGEITAADFDR